jgi:excisionase family DNA binding protein
MRFSAKTAHLRLTDCSLFVSGSELARIPSKGRTIVAVVLTLEEVASYLRVHPSTIYRLLRKRQLPAFKLGSDWRFNRESIDQWSAQAENRNVDHLRSDNQARSLNGAQ